jgi:hypothetical protein
LQLRVYVGDEKQEVNGELAEDLSIAVPDDDTRARLLRDGITRSVKINVMGEARFLKIVVYDSAADLVGTFSSTVK